MMAHVREVLEGARHPGRSAVRAIRAMGRAGRRGEPARPQLDVWSRTEPKYRRRAVILLGVNYLLFTGLCCFAFWLRTGEAIPFLVDGYGQELRKAFNPVGPEQVTLVDFLLRPINVKQAPMQIVVLGLLLATLVSIPILVAMLYRLPFAIGFVVLVAFVAVLPWLAVTVLVSCVLTRLGPLRFSFRYATALLGLIPAVLYFFNATRNPSVEATYATPIDAAAFYYPWILAILASCVIMALVLLIASLVNYRPGAIAPLMALLFVVPVALFEKKVGRDELHYRLLEREYGPHSPSFFRDQDVAQVVRRLALRRLKELEEAGAPRRPLAAIEQEIRLLWRFQLDSGERREREEEACREESIVQRLRDRAEAACDQFCYDFPTSRYIPNVLYLKGRALDMRVDTRTFLADGVLRYYGEFPSRASAETWATLYRFYPDSPAACVALYRSAQLEARAGRVDEAIRLLDEAIGRFGARGTTVPAAAAGILSKPPPTATLDIDVRATVLQARKFREMLVLNRDPHLARPPAVPADAPLVEYLRCDPRHELYPRNLAALLARYPFSRLRDHLVLEQVLAERSASLKIRSLEEFIRTHEGHPDADAVPAAYYRLAEAYLSDKRPLDAIEVLRRLIERYADSPWVEDAQRELTSLSPLRVAS